MEDSDTTKTLPFAEDIDTEHLGEVLIEMGERLTGDSDDGLRLSGGKFEEVLNQGDFSDYKLTVVYHPGIDDMLAESPFKYDDPFSRDDE